ncbi:hypothetical protein [Pseudomonas viridiflava]|uniref:hypothetical protein n=1 Tax=Pseudomonas viridiflava TaxID=33069 RepID=UPI000F02DB0E|nr:hypothetical protein [Pseudomonas viridiflava]
MLPDLSDFPSFPEYEAEWAPIYLEPIVQSGERLTIAVVASSGDEVNGCLTISEKALKCLYGPSAAGMQRMMTMALSRALDYAKSGFTGTFSCGIHGVAIGKVRRGLGENMSHILQQASSLSSSLSAVHSDALLEEDDDSDDPVAYELNLGQLRSDIQDRVLGILPRLKDRFNLPLHTQAIQGSRGSLFFAGNRMAASLAKIKPSKQISRHVDGAKSRLWDLHFVKYKVEEAPQNKCTLFIWTPKDLDRFDPALISEYEQSLEDLQRQSLEDGIEPHVFYGAEEAAAAIIDYERAA